MLSPVLYMSRNPVFAAEHVLNCLSNDMRFRKLCSILTGGHQLHQESPDRNLVQQGDKMLLDDLLHPSPSYIAVFSACLMFEMQFRRAIASSRKAGMCIIIQWWSRMGQLVRVLRELPLQHGLRNAGSNHCIRVVPPHLSVEADVLCAKSSVLFQISTTIVASEVLFRSQSSKLSLL